MENILNIIENLRVDTIGSALVALNIIRIFLMRSNMHHSKIQFMKSSSKLLNDKTI